LVFARTLGRPTPFPGLVDFILSAQNEDCLKVENAIFLAHAIYRSRDALNLLQIIRTFRRRRPRLFAAIVSMMVGGLIQVGFLIFDPQPLRLIRRSADDSADQMIRLAEETRGQLRRSPAFTFVNIDDATYNKWGSHPVTPREHLAVIIERLALSNPTAILVDVDLSFSDLANSDGEATLRKTLAQYPATAAPLLLVRSIYHDGPSPSLPHLRRTVYDPLVATKPNVMWGSPLFERDSDGKIRRWRLFVQACAGDRPTVLPALHLLGAVIARAKVNKSDILQAPKSLIDRLARFGADSCAAPNLRFGEIVEKQSGSANIEINDTEVSQRVLYRVGWRPDLVSIGPDIQTEDGLAPLIAVRPANLLTEGDPATPVPGVEGKFVVIGGSFADSGDWYETPLGRMPGGILLINAIEALALNGTPREPNLFETCATSSFIIVVTSFLAAFLRPMVAAFLAAASVFLIMLMSLPLFRSGVVLNLAIPAIGVTFYDLGTTMVEKFSEARKLGWSFILKRSDAEPKTSAEQDIPVILQSERLRDDSSGGT
jgi:CHASE2 domain-containing sensor protein